MFARKKSPTKEESEGERIVVRVVKKPTDYNDELSRLEALELADNTEDDDYETIEYNASDEPPRSRLRTLKHVLVSAFVLLFLLIGSGLAYTYFIGGSGNVPTTTLVAATAPDPTAGMVKPRKPSPKAPESASVQFISSPVKRNGAASLSVKTLPASNCSVIVDHDHIAVPTPDLKKKTADDFGTVNWDWTIPKAMPTGTSTATITCSYKDRSAVVQGDIVVK